MYTIYLLSAAAHAATLEVGPELGYPTLASAVAAARDGDLIRIHAGLGGGEGGRYVESVTLGAVHLVIEGVDDPVLQPASPFNGVLHVTDGGDVQLVGITIDGRGVGRAARVSSGASLTIRDSTIQRTGLDSAGGSLNARNGATLVLQRVVLRGAASTTVGGMIATEGDAALEVYDSVFAEGSSTLSGGAIHCSGMGGCVISGSLFADNTAGADGGAIASNKGAPVSVEGSRFCRNSASRRGGALSLHGPSIATRSVFVDNTTGTHGGAVWFDRDGPLVIEHSDFLRNTALSQGSAAYLQRGTLIASHNVFMDHQGETVLALGEATDQRHDNLWFGNQTTDGPGPGSITGDPAFTHLDATDCEGLVLTLQPGSAALGRDRASDIGAFGRHADAASAAAGLHHSRPAAASPPPHAVDPGPARAGDGAPAVVEASGGPGGCGCAAGSPAALSWLALPLALLATRRAPRQRYWMPGRH